MHITVEHKTEMKTSTIEGYIGLTFKDSTIRAIVGQDFFLGKGNIHVYSPITDQNSDFTKVQLALLELLTGI